MLAPPLNQPRAEFPKAGSPDLPVAIPQGTLPHCLQVFLCRERQLGKGWGKHPQSPHHLHTQPPFTTIPAYLKCISVSKEQWPLHNKGQHELLLFSKHVNKSCLGFHNNHVRSVLAVALCCSWGDSGSEDGVRLGAQAFDSKPSVLLTVLSPLRNS